LWGEIHFVELYRFVRQNIPPTGWFVPPLIGEKKRRHPKAPPPNY